MTERSAAVIQVAHLELLRSGEEASAAAVLSIGYAFLSAGRALGEVLELGRATPHDPAAVKRAAHRALGLMEALYLRTKHFRHPEAYQALLELAYA